MGLVANNVVLNAKNLAAVRGERLLFENLSFEMTQGSVIYLQGANGTGKTTLLRMICGLSKPYAGSVNWCGEKIDALAEEYYQHVLDTVFRVYNQAGFRITTIHSAFE